MKHYLNFAVKSILHRKVRSWLTIIGIIVGIASIVALISISQGLENAIKEQFEQMGSNKFYVITCKKIDSSFSCFELMSLKDARQALNDFKKANPQDSDLVELYLYYIKKAYALEKTDWRFQENFYSAIEKVFSMMVEILKKDSLLKDKYAVRVQSLIKQANEGWAHKETLEYAYNQIK